MKTNYEAECLANRKASSEAGLPFMPWTLQILGPIRFLSQLQAWLMSQFIVHADAAPCSTRRRRRDTRELVAVFLEFPLTHANNLHT
jgi:hypothetical protein